MKRKKKKGVCRICKEEKLLSFEHIPPKSAFNKNNRFQVFDSTDYYQNFEKYKKERPKSKIYQGGLGDYSLCEKCNSFLGAKYVKEYQKFAHIAMGILQEYDNENHKSYQFDISDIDLLIFLKQVVAIFVCSNDPFFTESYPELLEFIRDAEMKELSSRYRIYMFLFNKGQTKNGKLHVLNTHGVVCEFAYPPFGFILNVDNANRIMEATEITAFKFYNKTQMKNVKELPIILNKYELYYPFPLDFRLTPNT